MESNLPLISKRLCSIVRVFFFMLRKGFAKRKLVMGLNLMLKRPGKLASKAIANFISHHHHHGSSADDAPLQFSTAREYEFSCSNTPNYSFFSKRRHARHLFACAHAPLTLDDDVVVVNNALKKALEMLDDDKYKDAVEASPALPGFGRTPTATARQLRVTDSRFPVQDGDNDRDDQVDEAAEEFIKRFYKELRKQD
ncbi:uncharacterized protein LOC129287428 [Prosopis cineraria]|uniref:uncharacterized protein LOC129287428 n=1 Tax=Prosopis cineraria TaxID=364024 RepID=UPI00240FD596|nr:uncharacterized protein LOC129287428 [Prosopis cineraria]